MTGVFWVVRKALNSKESNLMYIVDIYLISPTVALGLWLCAHYSEVRGVNANEKSEFGVGALISHFFIEGDGERRGYYECEVRLTMSIVSG